METEFKALVHCGMYVDVNLLHKGIYQASKPCIYNKNETIESLIKQTENAVRIMGGGFGISNEYFKNLEQCKLVDVQIFVQAVP